jgi:hypothetical protein
MPLPDSPIPFRSHVLAPPKLDYGIRAAGRGTRLAAEEAYNQVGGAKASWLQKISCVQLRRESLSAGLKTEKGKELVHLTVRPGSVLGLPAIVSNEPYTLSAMAHHGSEVDFVARKDFEELMQEEPSLFPKVLEILAAEVRSARFVWSGVMGKLRSRASRVSA